MTWNRLITILLAVNAVCIVCDRFLLSSDRDFVKSKLTYWGQTFRDLRFPALPQLAASKSLRWFHVGNDSLQWVGLGIVITILSVGLTLQAFSVGFAIDGGWPYKPLLIFHLLSTWQISALVVFNLVSDLLVVFATFWSLQLLMHTPPAWRVLWWSYVAGGALYIVAEKRFGLLISFTNSFGIINFYAADRYLFHRQFLAESLYATASLIPFVFFLLVLLSLTVIKVAADVSIKLAYRLVTVEAEKSADRIAPFTLVGILFSAVAAIVKCALPAP